MRIFGFTIEKSKQQELAQSVSVPVKDDKVTEAATDAAGYFGHVLDFGVSAASEIDLIRRYREASEYPDADTAIEEIVSEAITTDHTSKVVKVFLDDLALSSNIKKRIQEEFDTILKLLNFDDNGHDIFRSWYVDGKVRYYVVIDKDNIKQGILSLRFIEPFKIKKIRKPLPQVAGEMTRFEEFYIYNDKGIDEKQPKGIRLSVDSVVEANSGNYDPTNGFMRSFLHKAIKPINMLKMAEDSLVVYRWTRAPERRIFYVDVGNLPKAKAEQYVQNLMNKYSNKITYDARTGEVKSDKRHLAMLEDFWMPRREGGKGTEITTLQGGQGLQNLDDIKVLQEKVYKSLNVPISRLETQQGFSLGRASEITRDEIKFSKFIGRLRVKFSVLFKQLLKIQLLAKGILDIDEWEEIEPDIRFDFVEDNHFAEFKTNEIMAQRLDLLSRLDPYVGKYYSMEWVRKNVLMVDDQEWKEMEKQIAKEPKSDGDENNNYTPEPIDRSSAKSQEPDEPKEEE